MDDWKFIILPVKDLLKTKIQKTLIALKYIKRQKIFHFEDFLPS